VAKKVSMSKEGGLLFGITGLLISVFDPTNCRGARAGKRADGTGGWPDITHGEVHAAFDEGGASRVLLHISDASTGLNENDRQAQAPGRAIQLPPSQDQSCRFGGRLLIPISA
jgi:hypothetical protein